MKLVLRFRHPAIAAGSATTVDLLVTLRAPAPVTPVRRPLALVCVLDVSGSMGGLKLRAVQSSLRRLVGQLVPGDRMAIVTFAEEVATPVPLVEITDASRDRIRAAVRALGAGGGTNLGGGLLAGLRLAAEATQAGGTARVLVLTDGMANHGPAQTREDLLTLAARRTPGVSISAFGYGDDCEHDLLGALADASGGGYAYLDRDDAVATAFARELGGLLATAAADVQVAVTLDGARHEARLEDVLFHGHGQVLLRGLPVGARVSAPAVELGTVEVRYLDSTGGPCSVRAPLRLDVVPAGSPLSEDREVAAAVAEAEVLSALEAAERLADQGRHEEAVARLCALPEGVQGGELADVVAALVHACRRNAYEGSGGLRTSAKSALARKRQRTNSLALAQLHQRTVSPHETEMERRFASDEDPDGDA